MVFTYFKGLEGPGLRIFGHPVGRIEAHEHGAVKEIHARRLHGARNGEIRAEKGYPVARDDRDRAPRDDLVDAELPVQVLFEPGFYREVGIGVEGDEENINVEAAG